MSPLKFRNLTVRNRILRSSISGRFDNYDGSGTQTRINWEEKNSLVAAWGRSFLHSWPFIAGRHVPNYATIHQDDQIPFWREVGKTVHQFDCKYLLQLNHAGRQMDFKGVDNLELQPLSSTNSIEPFSGFLCRAMTIIEIQTTIRQFAESARRVREAGLDGIELHGANGYLITQFRSSGINNRKDEYGGSVPNRARFLLEIIRAIRQEVGTDFHLQVKLNGIDYNNSVFSGTRKAIPSLTAFKSANCSRLRASTRYTSRAGAVSHIRATREVGSPLTLLRGSIRSSTAEKRLFPTMS